VECPYKTGEICRITKKYYPEIKSETCFAQEFLCGIKVMEDYANRDMVSEAQRKADD
jgi:hypothetical protein